MNEQECYGICERQSAVLIHAIGVRSVPWKSEEERAVTGVEREGEGGVPGAHTLRYWITTGKVRRYAQARNSNWL